MQGKYTVLPHKIMAYKEDTHISDIIAGNFNQVLLMEHLGMPLVVQRKTVKEFCTENNIKADLYLAFVALYDGMQVVQIPNFDKNDINCILTYLKNCHNYYLNEKIPQIKNYVKQISVSNNSSGIKLLNDFVNSYIEELTEHFEYENNIVFPYITALSQNQTLDSSYSVTIYKQHHNNIDESLSSVKELLIKYLNFTDEQNIRRKMLACLFELEYDLKIHSHIEDNILIPLVEKYENIEHVQKDKSENVLSQREIDVLKYLIEGLSNKEVAEKLYLSTHTVISHRKNICEKTRIKSLAGLTIYAILNGIINIDSLEEKQNQNAH